MAVPKSRNSVAENGKVTKVGFFFNHGDSKK
jgi:hypothetical protein